MFFENKALNLMAAYEPGCKQIAQARMAVLTPVSLEMFDQWLTYHILDMADDILNGSGIDNEEAEKIAAASVAARSDSITSRITGWGNQVTAAVVTYFQVRADFAKDEESWNRLMEILDEEVAERAQG